MDREIADKCGFPASTLLASHGQHRHLSFSYQSKRPSVRTVEGPRCQALERLWVRFSTVSQSYMHILLYKGSSARTDIGIDGFAQSRSSVRTYERSGKDCELPKCDAKARAMGGGIGITKRIAPGPVRACWCPPDPGNTIALALLRRRSAGRR